MDEGSGSAEGYLPEIAREDMAKSPRPLGLLTEMIPTTLSFFPNTISTNVCVHIATPHHKGCPHHLIQSIKTGLLGGLSSGLLLKQYKSMYVLRMSPQVLSLESWAYLMSD